MNMHSMWRFSADQEKKSVEPLSAISPLERAVGWVKEPPSHGGYRCSPQIAVRNSGSHGLPHSEPVNAGEEELAVELAAREASVQKPDGSFAAPDGVPYTFDTAQVIRGFLAVLDRVPQFEPNLRRACDYVANQIAPTGGSTARPSKCGS